MTSFRDMPRSTPRAIPGEVPLDDSVRAFAVDVRTNAGPTAGDALLAHILENRANGLRVVLPSGELTTAGASAWWSVRRIGSLAAAAIVMIAVSMWWTTRRQREASGLKSNIAARSSVASANADSGATTSTSPAAALGRLFAPWPQVAYAQSPGVTREPPFAPIVITNTSRLVAARRSYVRSVASDYHTLLPSAVFEVETSRSTYRGVPAWVVVTRTPSHRAVPDPASGDTRGFDTLWLRADNLRPIARRNHMGAPLMFATLFTATEVKESLRVDSAMHRRAVAMIRAQRLPRARPAVPRQREVSLHDVELGHEFSSPIDSSRILVTTEAAMRLLLRSVALSSSWKGSIGVQDGAYAPMTVGAKQYVNLRVVGVDTVQTFSGRFPCWRVLLDLGRNPGIWHVSQETGETLLAEGPWGESYAVSETRLIYGLEETRQAPRLKVTRAPP